MQYKAVIFDLDGTLIDSLADIAESVNEMLVHYGYPIHPVEDYKLMVGNGSHELIVRCMPKGTDAQRIDEGVSYYKKVYENRFLEKTRSYDGILDLLKALVLRGIPLAICTNKPTGAAHTIVEVLFEKDTFIEVVGDEPGQPRKPDPKKVLKIADRMGLMPQEIVYIGDSQVDMQTAVNAKMLPVGVLWGFRDKDELEEHGAAVLLNRPLELVEKITFQEN